MNEALQVISQHGYPLLFCWVLAEQAGAPIPAAPALIAAGALIASGHLSLGATVAAALSGSLLADCAYYCLGRYGAGFLSRRFAGIGDSGRSLELSLILGKFVPFVSLAVPPLSGASGMRLPRFLALDTLGSLVWIGSLVGGGYTFGNAITGSSLVPSQRIAGLCALLAAMVAAAMWVWRDYWKGAFYGGR